MSRILSCSALAGWGGLLLAMTGGIDQISIDLSAPSKQLVVNFILTPDSLFRVEVSRATSATEATSRLFATAQASRLNPGGAVEILRNQGNGLYYSPTKPSSGIPYGLQVAVPGYPSVSATNTIPALVPIREA